MKLLKVDTLEEAREKLLAAAKPPRTECVSFAQSLDRILSENILTADNVPAFRKSTVDGYAVRAADTQGVTESIPVFLDVIEEIQMGMAPRKKISAGQAAYVPTGGMLPEGADAVVMVEYCEKFDEASIAVYDAVSAGRNMISAGEDLEKGQVFLKKGACIRPQEIGAMASAGVAEVEVFKPWRITIISTGDELVSPDQIPEKGQVRDINTHALAAAAEKNGFQVIGTHVLQDDESLLEETVRQAMQESDLVAVSGGSSQGEKDHTAAVLDRLGTPGVFTHGIALKPGKPTILGYDKTTETVLLGLPGHPAAALMVFELMAAWLYRQLTGQKEARGVTARLTENVAAAGGRATCLMVKLQGEKAIPVLGKSGLMRMLTEADGYVLIPTDAEGLKEGQEVEVMI